MTANCEARRRVGQFLRWDDGDIVLTSRQGLGEMSRVANGSGCVPEPLEEFSKIAHSVGIRVNENRTLMDRAVAVDFHTAADTQELVPACVEMGNIQTRDTEEDSHDDGCA